MLVGTYIDQITEQLEYSMLARQNLIILSPPGWGKTQIALQAARELFDHYVFIRIDPSTPPEVLKGAYDPAKLLNGQLERIVDHTPYDPDVEIVILDEVFRGNDVVFDIALDVLDRVDSDVAPFVWATSNFVAQGERLEALKDRFAMWMWINPQIESIQDIVSAQFKNEDLNLPEKVELNEVWQMFENVGPRAIEVIASTIQMIVEDLVEEGFTLNPRRIAQWTRLLASVSIYETGQSDFTSIPECALRSLCYAYPTESYDDAMHFRSIILSLADPVGSAIDEVMSNVVVKFREISSIEDISQRTAKVGELGKILADSQALLRRVGGDDPRVERANEKIMEWFSAAVAGREIS